MDNEVSRFREEEFLPFLQSVDQKKNVDPYDYIKVDIITPRGVIRVSCIKQLAFILYGIAFECAIHADLLTTIKHKLLHMEEVVNQYMLFAEDYMQGSHQEGVSAKEVLCKCLTKVRIMKSVTYIFSNWETWGNEYLSAAIKHMSLKLKNAENSIRSAVRPQDFPSKNAFRSISAKYRHDTVKLSLIIDKTMRGYIIPEHEGKMLQVRSEEKKREVRERSAPYSSPNRRKDLAEKSSLRKLNGSIYHEAYNSVEEREPTEAQKMIENLAPQRDVGSEVLDIFQTALTQEGTPNTTGTSESEEGIF